MLRLGGWRFLILSNGDTPDVLVDWENSPYGR